MRSVAFLGLGVMGRGMAARLIDQGFSVALWNRTREAAEALARAAGPSGRARVADTPREAARGADVVVSMVADDGASRAVWLGDHGALAGAQAESILIESSTVSPVWIEELAATVGPTRALLDAPVTGSRTHAGSGQLLFLVGGSSAVLERTRPVLAAMSRAVLHVGPTGSGARLKLINNFVCGVQAATLAEALVMIDRAGLTRDIAAGVLAEGAPGSPLVKAVGPRMTGGDYDVHFALDLMRKDLTYAIAEGDRLGLDLATATAALGRFAEASAAGFGASDFSAVIEAPRRDGKAHQA